ncbi:hypothetical protein [Pinibacter aurantiacus]|uniref:Uncharacterized protein n=1 Tax=Pinibacter aurantiacus TaxID=2851599 RepID=A0A9E2W7W1_9BACT|nr:hypothetical protein [Pinibacter aurantiacus]MBV4357361.1 hypothetical protein [Pinibacter aurantiacus]
MNKIGNNATIHIDLSNVVEVKTEEEIQEDFRLGEEMKKYIGKWLDLNDDQQFGKAQLMEKDTEFYTHMGRFYDEARRFFETRLKTDIAPGNLVSVLNTLFTKQISVYRYQLDGPDTAKSDRINYQIKILEDLRAFVFIVHQANQSQRKMEEFKSCVDFCTLVKKYGDSENLRQEYLQQVKNAPSKKLMLERRISSLEKNKERTGCRLHSWFPRPENKIEFEFGEYYRIGYAWMIAGYNATWHDLETATLRNLSVNAVFPPERRSEAYVMLIHQLIRGGAMAIHIAFLHEELDHINAAGSSSFSGIHRMTHKIHFEDFSGQQFERLVLAYLQRVSTYGDSPKWYGESGADGGRDIWSQHNDKTWCFQCANYQSLTFGKIKKDIDKLVNGKTVPSCYVVIAGGKVSAGTRKKIINYCNQQNIDNADIWSGAEFQEKLQGHAPDLLKRFCEGDPFPEIEGGAS